MTAFENANTTKLINQIKSAKDQYPILSKEEERELIEKYRNDREKLNQLLCLHNVKMVFSMARSFVTKTKDFDSLVQNGMLGLMEAAKRFDIDKNIKFCTYASIWIRKYFSMQYYTAQYKMDQATCSLDEPAAFGSDDDTDDTSFLENSLHKYIDPTFQDPVKSRKTYLLSCLSTTKRRAMSRRNTRWIRRRSQKYGARYLASSGTYSRPTTALRNIASWFRRVNSPLNPKKTV